MARTFPDPRPNPPSAFPRARGGVRGLMRKAILSAFAFYGLVMCASNAQAQVAVTNPGNTTPALAATYTSLANAITALNSTTAISGQVIITLTGNEAAPAGGYSITAIPTGSSATNNIVIQGSSSTITASAALTVGNTNDAIFKLIGADWITIQNFTMQENPANTISGTAATNNMTEWGVALLYASLTNGAQNNTVQNNTISLNRTYLNTFGVYSNTRHSATAVTTTAEVTAATGANSNNKVYGNAISNVNYGIVFVGAGTTIAAIDTGTDIGGSSAPTGNTITNWGGGSSLTSYTSVTGSNFCIFLNQQINDNVSFNTITSASGLATTIVQHGGILKNYSVANPTGTITTTLNNNTVTVSNSPTTGQMTGITAQGLTTLSTATININNNLITGSLSGASATSAAFIGILGTSAPGTLNINNNTVRGVTTTATTGGFVGIQQQTGGVVTTLNINNNKIGDATAGAVTFSTASNSGTVTGLAVTSTGAASTCALAMTGNDFRGIVHSSVGSGAHLYISNAATTLSQNISSNTFTNLNVNTTGSVTFIADSVSAPSGGSKTINSNSIVTAFSKGGAGGTIALYTDGGSSTATAGIQNNSNNFSNITVTGATTITGWFNNDGTGATPAKTITGNTFSNWTCGTNAVTVLQSNFGNPGSVSSNTITSISGQAAITGLLIGSSGTVSALNLSTNTVTGLSSTGTGGAVTGISNSVASTTTANINGNTINNLSSASTTSVVAGITTSASANLFSNTINTLSCVGTTSGVTNGIMVTGGATGNVFKNKIYDLSTSGASTTVPGVNGIVFSGSTSGVTISVYNNLIGDLRAATCASTDAIRGLSITATGTTSTYNVYYNSVNIAATSSGTNFGTTGIFHTISTTSTTAALNLRNNVIVNTSTPNGTGLTVAYRRSAGAASNLANYASTSNNNDFYAGTPGASRLIYSDGTSTAQTIAAYKAGVFTAGTIAPRDSASISENPPFLSTAGSSADFLHIDPTQVSSLESGAVNITTFTDDFDGQTRQGNAGYAGSGTAPDIGADEFNQTLGLTPPTLTAAAGATVDNPFIVTFTDDSAWRAAITSITVGGTTLSTSAYSVAAGQITFTPSQSSLLQSAGTKAIAVIANGYSNATVSQAIGAGAANKLAITTQPAAPVSNPGTLGTQPVVAIQDQYGNTTTSTATVTAAVGAGTWTIGGTTSKAGVSGTATFTDLTATASAPVTGATISFTSSGLTGVTSNTFNIPGPSVFYSKATGNLDDVTTWGTNTDGSGGNPANFTTAGQIFNIRNNPTPTIGATWTVSGSSSKIVVGDGTNACNFTIPPSFAVSGTTDVSASAILTNQNTANPTFGTLAATSTVDYNGTGAQTVAVANYGNLTISGTRTGTPAITLASGTVDVAGTFSVTESGAVTYTNTGNTVNFSSASSQTIPAINYATLTNGGNGDRVFASSGAIGIATSFSKGSGNYTTTGSTVNFNGTAGATIVVLNYNNLTISGTGTFTFSGSFTGGNAITGNYSQTGAATVLAQATGNSSARTITINGNFSVSAGTFTVITGTTNVNTAITIGGSMILSGTAKVNLESVDATAGVATFNVAGNFTSTGTSVASGGGSGVIDFGATTVAGNAINIAGNFSKTGAGTFGTSAVTSATGFAFNGNGTQTFSDDGVGKSQYTQYVVNSGSTLQMLTGVTLGTGTNPTSTFTVNGTLDVGTQVITSTSGDTNATFTLSAGATLKTGNATGLGGSITVGGTKTFSSAANYTYNGGVNQAVGTVTYTPTANTVANLTIANTGASPTNVVSLGSVLSATGTLTLTSGILTTTTTNTLTLTNTATTAVSGGSATSFVNGPLNWTLPASLSSSSSVYPFPVGAGTTYLPLSLTTITTGATGPVLQVQANASSAGGTPDGTTVTGLSTTEFWSNKVVSGNFTNGVISLTRQTPVAPFTLIAKSTTQAGTYSSIGGTASGNSINNSSLVGAITAASSQFYVLGQTQNITVTGSLTAFSTTYGTPSATQTLSVSGSGLTANITATAPAGYEVSSDGTSYGSTATFTQSGGSASGTLSIRIAALTAPSSAFGTTLAFTSTGATTQNVTVSGTVNKFTPAVAVTGTTSFTYTGSPQGPNTSSVTGVSGGATPTGTVTYSYTGTGATIYGPSATQPTNAGSYTVTASYPGDANYNAASSSATAFTIAKANQTITFTLTSPVPKSQGTVTLTGTASSGLTVTYSSSDPAIASVSGSTLTLNKAGTVTITADQAGDGNYNAAPSVARTLIITGFTAGNDTVTRLAGSASFKIPKSTLLTNDGTVAANGTVNNSGVTIMSVASGTDNTVSESGAFVFYIPSNASASAPLTFTYVAGDGTSTDTATVTVLTAAQPSFELTIVEAGTPIYNGTTTTITVGFITLPGQVLKMEYSTNMVDWTLLTPNVDTDAGSFQLTVTAAGDHTGPSGWPAGLFFRGTRQ